MNKQYCSVRSFLPINALFGFFFSYAYADSLYLDTPLSFVNETSDEITVQLIHYSEFKSLKEFSNITLGPGESKRAEVQTLSNFAHVDDTSTGWRCSGLSNDAASEFKVITDSGSAIIHLSAGPERLWLNNYEGNLRWRLTNPQTSENFHQNGKCAATEKETVISFVNELPEPQGSYLSRCKERYYDPKSGNLSAECKDRKGDYKYSQIYYDGTCDLSDPNVSNDNGFLRCDRFRIKGSYLSSCRNINVSKGGIVTAECKDKKGRFTPQNYAYYACVNGSTMSNHDGEMYCDPR